MPDNNILSIDEVTALINITEICQQKISTANLCNLHFLKNTDNFLDKIISLNIFDPVSPLNYWYNTSDSSANPDLLLSMVRKVQEDAKETKLILRQAALQSASDYSKITEYQYRLKILLSGLHSSLDLLYHELCDWSCLPLFNLPIDLAGNQR